VKERRLKQAKQKVREENQDSTEKEPNRKIQQKEKSPCNLEKIINKTARRPTTQNYSRKPAVEPPSK